MDEQRVEVYFDSLRPDYLEYLNALEKRHFVLRCLLFVVPHAMFCGIF